MQFRGSTVAPLPVWGFHLKHSRGSHLSKAFHTSSAANSRSCTFPVQRRSDSKQVYRLDGGPPYTLVTGILVQMVSQSEHWLDSKQVYRLDGGPPYTPVNGSFVQKVNLSEHWFLELVVRCPLFREDAFSYVPLLLGGIIDKTSQDLTPETDSSDVCLLNHSMTVFVTLVFVCCCA